MWCDVRRGSPLFYYCRSRDGCRGFRSLHSSTNVEPFETAGEPVPWPSLTTHYGRSCCLRWRSRGTVRTTSAPPSALPFSPEVTTTYSSFGTGQTTLVAGTRSEGAPACRRTLEPDIPDLWTSTPESCNSALKDVEVTGYFPKLSATCRKSIVNYIVRRKKSMKCKSPNQKNYVDNHPPCTKWRVP